MDVTIGAAPMEAHVELVTVVHVASCLPFKVVNRLATWVAPIFTLRSGNTSQSAISNPARTELRQAVA